jgi:hypothetical protein
MRVNLNLHQRATTPQSESRGSTPEPQSAEEKQRLAEEASRIAAEKELDKYFTEPLHENATDAPSCDILSYWNVRDFVNPAAALFTDSIGTRGEVPTPF